MGKNPQMGMNLVLSDILGWKLQPNHNISDAIDENKDNIKSKVAKKNFVRKRSISFSIL